ncbi:hypothetical protein [Dyella sp. 2HG41-7]|uniref:hypothetical protein n=1 Tax=Dyella sp. 2HG41-7 TaxID=2883239 RepID=UPI001F1EEC57|nr:hypothetical protein [Dyella sp. 2HG41-7]
MQEQAWKTYEEVAAYLLNQFATQFGVGRFDGKQLITGDSGTQWEIDAKGFTEGRSYFIVVECKRYSARGVAQDVAASLAWRIQDTGASGGILVSPVGLQSGARLVADKAGIIEVRLAPNSTNKDYVLSFLNRVCVGVSDRAAVTDRLSAIARDEDGNVIWVGQSKH